MNAEDGVVVELEKHRLHERWNNWMQLPALAYH